MGKEKKCFLVPDNELLWSKGLLRIVASAFHLSLSLYLSRVSFSTNSRLSGLKLIELSFFTFLVDNTPHFYLAICGCHCQGLIS